MLDIPILLAAGAFDSDSILWKLFAGLVVGVIAKMLMPGKDPGGCIITMLIGLAGAFVGGWIGSMFWTNYAVGWIMAILGAMLLLFLYRMVMGKKGGG